MQFYFIRHAQSANNQLWAKGGPIAHRSEDPELTDLGIQQAERLATFLARPQARPRERTDPIIHDCKDLTGFHITHLYCSLMVRAVATGLIVAHAIGMPLVAWPDVHETGGIHYHDPETGELIGLPGHNRAYFKEHYPSLVLPDALGEEGWWNRPFEAHDVRRARADRFLHDLLERHGDTDDRVAVISHGGFYNQLMHSVLGIPEGPGFWFFIDNTGITSLRFQDDERWVCYQNRTEHLPPDLIT
ncbi:MAG: histidine phosphatase family protein [Anaerolineae bacterium]|nr:histidine phosphatase family protein [Anaerolineae bacterium]